MRPIDGEVILFGALGEALLIKGWFVWRALKSKRENHLWVEEVNQYSDMKAKVVEERKKVQHESASVSQALAAWHG